MFVSIQGKSLADARVKQEAVRQLFINGVDPLAQRKAEHAAGIKWVVDSFN